MPTSKKDKAGSSRRTTNAGMIRRTQEKEKTKAATVKLQPALIESIIKTVQDLAIVSKYAAESEFFVGLDTPAKASMVIEKGRELGIHTVSACQVIHPIKTQDGIKLAIEAKLYAAIAMNLGVRWKIHEKTPAGCKLEFYSITDKTIPNHIDTFTMVDAARAGLAKKNNWVWYPEEMCYWRCFLKNCRIFDARICMGLYSVQEVNDFEKITNGDGDEIYVIPDTELLESVGIPDTETAPTQTVAETLPIEDEVKGTVDIKEAEDLGLGMHSEEEEYFDDEEEQEPMTEAEEGPPQPTTGVVEKIMPFEEGPTPTELTQGKRDIAPETPVDPGILIHKQVVVDFMKVQGMENLYTTFKEWLGSFQTSREPMRNFVARNQFGKWSISKGSIEDLKLLTDNLKWTMDKFISYCFIELKLKSVGIHKNPAMNAEPE